MYKIMLADDEGIVLDALCYIIKKNFDGQCQIRTAKSGRAAIELAEEFQPDIALMDIRMPGINGIDAIRELRQTNRTTIFIVVSAYDSFDYAAESIELGVMAFLTKPLRKERAIEVIQKAMNQVDAARQNRNSTLLIREKLESAMPVLESGFIYTVLLQTIDQHLQNYRPLLGITKDRAYAVVLRFQRSNRHENDLEDSYLSDCYAQCRDMVKSTLPAIVGPLMSDRIVAVVPCDVPEDEYSARLSIMEKCRVLIDRINSRLDLSIQIGIGSVLPFPQLYESYQQAITALDQAVGEIAHVNDLPLDSNWEQGYPIDLENHLWEAVQKGNLPQAQTDAGLFFDWMASNYGQHLMDIRLKCIEFVLRAEYISFHTGGQDYQFLQRKGYLEAVLSFDSLPALRSWYLEKVSAACRRVFQSKSEKTNSTIALAQDYIRKHFQHDLTLDDVSRAVHVSPYYFSKLFKDETGENFVEYLTKLRIHHAKSMLSDPSNSIKQVCLSVGYSDPSYFSRIFKKYEGITPSEFRDISNQRG